MKRIRRCFRWLIGDYYVVRKQFYHGSYGGYYCWATYNPFRKAVMHTDIHSRNLAQTYCDRMNRDEYHWEAP